MCSLLIFVVISTVISQVIGAPSVITSDDKDAQKQLDGLAEYTQEQIDIGTEKINGISDMVGVELKKAAGGTLNKIGSDVRVLSQQLEKIKDDAKSAGKDISDCLKDDEAFFIQITDRNQYERVVTSTIIGKALTAAYFISDALTKIIDTYDYWEEIKAELEKCKTGGEEKCFDDVVAHIDEVKPKIPVEITQLVEGASNNVTPVLAETRKQLEEFAVQLQTQAKATVDGIAECASKK